MTEEKKQTKMACVDVESIGAANALLSHGIWKVALKRHYQAQCWGGMGALCCCGGRLVSLQTFFAA